MYHDVPPYYLMFNHVYPIRHMIVYTPNNYIKLKIENYFFETQYKLIHVFRLDHDDLEHYNYHNRTTYLQVNISM